MQNIILLHGALGSQSDLNPLSDKLKEQGIDPYILNFSGHGQAIFEKQFGIEQFTNELERLILKNSLQQPHVFGYSMGGYVALNLARTKPRLMGKLITLGTKFKWNKEIAGKEASMLNAGVIQQKLPGYAEILEAKHGKGWVNLVTKTSEMMKDIGDTIYLDHSSFITIENTVFIGLGDRDKMVSYEETFNVYKSLPNAGMYMLPNAVHQLESVNAQLLAKMIGEFIKQEE